MLVGRWRLLLDQVHPELVDSEASLPFTPLHRKDQNWQTLTKEANPLFIMLLLILITSAIKEMVITRVSTHPAGGSTYHIMQSRSCISIAATIQYKNKRCPHYGPRCEAKAF